MIAVGALALLVAVLFKVNHDQGEDIKQGQHGLAVALEQIQQSRIVLSAQSCRQRNNERAVQRSNLHQSQAQLAKVPDSGLESLGFSREEAEANIERQLKQVAPLDCKKLVRQVAGNKAGKVGGGPGAFVAPRPRGQGSRKTRPGRGGGSSPAEPRTPKQPGQPKPNPSPGSPGAPGTPNSPGQPPGNGDGGVVKPKPKLPDVKVPDVRDVPRKVAPELCQIKTPLGPVVKLCP